MATRERILLAASEVFSERGYERATMDAIAQRSGMSKGALYYFFKSKAELFIAIVESGLDMLKARIGECINSDEAPRAILRRIVATCVDMCLDNSEYARIVLGANFERLDDGLGKRVLNLLEDGANSIIGAINLGIREQIIAPADAELTATAFIGMLAGMVARRISYAEPPKRAQMVDAICHILLDGLLPQNGGKANA